MALLVVAAIFVFAPRSEQRALAVSENQGSGPSALNDDRFLFANLADQVIPSVVTVYVKRDLKRNMTPEELRQFEQFRRFFQGPDNPFQGSPFEFFFGPDQGQEPDQQDPGNENPHAPDGENNPFLQQASGSGVIISADGYIITNWHVVGDKDQGTSITVVFSDNSELDNNHVKLVESNRLLDLALLKVDRKGLKPIQWGDSDKLRIGERVACVGSPLDLRETVTQGIVCAMHRNVDIGIGDMIQTDAVINPGSSGGAMVNLEGQLVGINRLITSRTGWWQGYGFAIPANDVRYFTDQVIRTGHFTAGYIGIEMAPDENTGQMREALGIPRTQKGVLIKDVRTHTPAAEAGLQALDYIIKADSTNITSSSDLLGFVARTPVGTKIDLTILRPVKFKSPKEMKVTIKVAERPSEKILSEQMRGGEGMGPGTPAPAGEKMLGMSVEPTQYNGIDVLKVTGVERRSPAASAGLRAGDIITKFDGEPVSSVDQLKSAIANQPKGRPHWVEFVRQGQRNLTTIPQ